MPGIDQAIYTLTVQGDAGDVVWSQRVASSRYGNGEGGDISYVGPCDAEDRDGDGEATNTATLTLDSLPPLDASEWADPGPVVKSFTCVENADTPVTFDLTILRSGGDGFVDYTVDIDQLLCSAKVDCEYSDGSPIELVFDENGDRGQTAVLAISCHADVGDDLHINGAVPVIVCEDGTVHAVDLGTTSASVNTEPGALTFGEMTTADVEVRGDQEYLFWSAAIGLNPPSGHGACRLLARFTPSRGPLPDGALPAGTVYPAIVVDVPLNNAADELTCGQHPLVMGDGPVGVSYDDVGLFPIFIDQTPAGPIIGQCLALQNENPVSPVGRNYEWGGATAYDPRAPHAICNDYGFARATYWEVCGSPTPTLGTCGFTSCETWFLGPTVWTTGNCDGQTFDAFTYIECE